MFSLVKENNDKDHVYSLSFAETQPKYQDDNQKY